MTGGGHYIFIGGTLKKIKCMIEHSFALFINFVEEQSSHSASFILARHAALLRGYDSLCHHPWCHLVCQSPLSTMSRLLFDEIYE
jgi:hypothetical protein